VATWEELEAGQRWRAIQRRLGTLTQAVKRQVGEPPKFEPTLKPLGPGEYYRQWEAQFLSYPNELLRELWNFQLPPVQPVLGPWRYY